MTRASRALPPAPSLRTQYDRVSPARAPSDADFRRPWCYLPLRADRSTVRHFRRDSIVNAWRDFLGLRATTGRCRARGKCVLNRVTDDQRDRKVAISLIGASMMSMELIGAVARPALRGIHDRCRGSVLSTGAHITPSRQRVRSRCLRPLSDRRQKCPDFHDHRATSRAFSTGRSVEPLV